jgi:hypothetical protein
MPNHWRVRSWVRKAEIIGGATYGGGRNGSLSQSFCDTVSLVATTEGRAYTVDVRPRVGRTSVGGWHAVLSDGHDGPISRGRTPG